MEAHSYLIIGVFCTILGAAFTVTGTIKANQDASLTLQKTQTEIIQETARYVTGGDSFIYVEPAKVSNRNVVLLLTKFSGKYPLFDVSLSVNEFNQHFRKNSFEWFGIKQYLKQWGTVNPLKQFESLDKIFIPIKSNNYGKKFFIKIDSRNFMMEVTIILRVKNGIFSHAFKVIRFLPSYEKGVFGNEYIDKVIGEVRHIDENFPIEELEHVKGSSSWGARFNKSTGRTF